MSPGAVVSLSSRVRRIVAPNPGVMTGPGTNTYLVGREDLAVIDPGPDIPEHLDAVAAAGDGRIRWILVTHTHSDHSPGAAPLRERLAGQATLLGYDERDGFVPDSELRDGNCVEGSGFRLRALHTPGHASNHLCYFLEEERLLFSGDHIMSGSTVVIGPPDGDMAAYLRALEAVRALDAVAIAPGHGRVIDDPEAKIDEYLTHRLMREEAVAAALLAAGAPLTVEELVPIVYTDVNAALHPIARFSLWAHLRKLVEDGRARAGDADDLATTWEIRAGV
jgi:glyoxylase-like metal-dependent hydrolase (beta-lactamase superfamily II)